MTANPHDVINRAFGPYLAPGRHYHSPLPAELEQWYCYTKDGGHSIAVALDTGDLGAAPTREDLEYNLCPAPVKSVLRAGWRLHDGFVICKLPYDPELGLITTKGDDEYGDAPAPAAADQSKAPLHSFAVGQPYNPKVTRWQDGMAELRLTPQGAEFALFLANPAPHEVNAFRRGNAEFALVPSQRHLMWCYRFGNPKSGNPQMQGPGIPWSDTPWEYHRQAIAEPVAVPGERGASFPLHLVLVDAATGITKALRLVAPPVEFADALRDAVARQEAAPYDKAAADREIQAVYARYPSSTDLLLAAAARFEALRD